MSARGGGSFQPLVSDAAPTWLAWEPGERETYLRRSSAVLWGAGGLTLVAAWWIVYNAPSPSSLLGLAIAATLVVIATEWLAASLIRHLMPEHIVRGSEGVTVRRKGRSVLIPWARFRARYSGSIWYAGFMWIGYRGVGRLDPGTLWVSRSMSDAELARPEAAPWRLRLGGRPLLP